MKDELDGDQFMTVRDDQLAAAKDKGIEEIARQLRASIENDSPRTTKGAIALGLALELEDRVTAE